MENLQGKKGKGVFFLVLTILFFLCAVASPWEVLAEENAEEVVDLGDVVFSAQRSPIPRENVAANVTVITAEEMEKIPANTIGEVLEHFPGLHIEARSWEGNFTSAIIQGSEMRHVAVYQDGVPLNQLANPVTDLSMISLESVQRVEVYKGAASSSWGSALGGVINIVTKNPPPDKPVSVSLKTSYGEHQTFKNRGSVSGTVERLGYLVSYTHNESDGFAEHTDYKHDSIYSKLGYQIGDSNWINLIVSHTRSESADPLPIYPEFWDDADQERSYQRLQFETALSDTLMVTLEARHLQYDITVEDVYVDHRVLYNDYDEETWGMSARARWDSHENNTVVAGADSDWGTYDWFGFDRDYDTRNSAVYVNDTLNLGNLSINAGVRQDDNRDFGGETSPSLGVVYRFPRFNTLVRAQVARGFNAPPPSWIHDPVFGNPDLEPETAINYQAGIEVTAFDFLTLAVNGFRADVDDLIVFDHDTWMYQNIEEVTRQGVEGTITAAFDCGLTLSFGANYTDVTNDVTDEKIEDIPRTTFHVKTIYTNDWMTHSLIGKYIDHNSSYDETRDERFVFDYLVKVKLPVSAKFGKPQLFAAVYNVFDSDYLYRKAYPQPDRWAEAGVILEF